jgi:UDP-glucuronate decarboxylase
LTINDIVADDLERIHAGLTSREKLRNATVIMTGCAGFVGFYAMQFLTRHAKRLDVRRVIGLDTFILDRPAWLELLQQDHPEILEVHKFDIARDDIGCIAGAREAAFVIHAASIASPIFYRKYPLETVDANIWGLRRLLDFYAESKLMRGFLFFSSSEVYGDPVAASIPTPEEYRGNVACIGPRACYDESKRFGETICQIFAHTRGLPITIARPFNNYGPGMRLGDRRLPADLAYCVMHGRDIEIMSDGTPTRTFCYISDAMTGYMLCLLHGRFDVFNIGVERPEISVAEMARIFRRRGAELTGYRGEIKLAPSSDPDYLTDNPNRRCPVIKKAREILGYGPRVAVENGVGRYLRFLIAETARQ